MKKLLSLFLLVSFSFISLHSFANDAKAKSILDNVSSKMKSAKTLKANFVFTMRNAKNVNVQTVKGTFTMKGVKYHINAGVQEMICDGKSIWTYIKKNNEVQIATYDPSEQTISPTKLFSGSYESEYNYSYKGARTLVGKAIDIIELTPKANKSFSSVDLYIYKNGNIAGGMIHEKNGSSYIYNISNLNVNSNIPDTEFIFNTNAHPGVDVIDLR